jgi:hypothetical protein
MASRFGQAVPAVVWIVGELSEGTTCRLGFPSAPGTYPNVQFSEVDENEAYLSAFDRAGIRVWLQVEPGMADVAALIDLVLGRYGSHPSVVGFGVDVEWYRSQGFPEGQQVTDIEAEMWAERVQSYDSDYLLFLKHWLASKMPPTARSGIVFIDDSQEFGSLDEVVEEFSVWGRLFYPTGVGFQFGYEADRGWWCALADPARDIGEAILARVPNTVDLYWVDFSAYSIWPPLQE